MDTYIDTITESETDLETWSDTESDTESDDYDEYISDDDDEVIDEYNELMNLLHPVHMISSHYYIGCYTAVPDDRYRWLLVNKIHKHTFMKFNGDQLSNYFFGYSGIWLPNNTFVMCLLIIFCYYCIYCSYSVTWYTMDN